MLKDFTRVATVPQKVIKKYKDQVPEELVKIWEEDGLGTFLDGYLKVINPDEYLELVQETYFRGDISVPIFATAFGDVIVCEEKQYLRMVKYKDGIFDTIFEKIPLFIKFVNDKDFTDDYFDLPLYHEAVEKYGLLDYAECFGFVPLLALGGFKDVNHLNKVKIYEHILLITQLAGPIGD